MNVLEQARAQLEGCIAERTRLGESLRHSCTSAEHRAICDEYKLKGDEFVAAGIVGQVVDYLPSGLGIDDYLEWLDRQLASWTAQVINWQVPVYIQLESGKRDPIEVYAWGFATTVLPEVAGALGLDPDASSGTMKDQDARYLLIHALQPIGRQRAQALFNC